MIIILKHQMFKRPLWTQSPFVRQPDPKSSEAPKARCSENTRSLRSFLPSISWCNWCAGEDKDRWHSSGDLRHLGINSTHTVNIMECSQLGKVWDRKKFVRLGRVCALGYVIYVSKVMYVVTWWYCVWVFSENRLLDKWDFSPVGQFPDHWGFRIMGCRNHGKAPYAKPH